MRAAGRTSGWVIAALVVAGIAFPKAAAQARSTGIRVANTGGEGVRLRPTSDTSQPSVGWMPEGASPDYHCYEWGERINDVPVWFNVTYNGVTGFYSSYYDDSRYADDAELQSRYGVPKCGEGAPPSTAPTPAPTASWPATSGPASVFFSPNDEAATGTAGLPAISDRDLKKAQWAPGNCNTILAASPDVVPASVRTLAGWSVGRLGPLYYLSAAGTEARRAQVQTIILFDPGSQENMEEEDGCDTQLHPSINSLLADWLRSSDRHQLLVLAGRDTEEHTYYLWGRSRFSGLWKYYFAEIWNQDFAGRALVCDYNGMGHEDVLRTFYGVVKHPPDGCPVATGKPLPTAWHP